MSFVALCVPFFTISAAESLSPQVAQRVRAATVMVSIEYDGPNAGDISWGTGFVIGNGLVLTNAHVVTEKVPRRIFLRNEFLPPTEARIVAARYDTNEFVNAEVVEYIATTLLENARIDGVFLAKSFTNYDVALLAFTAPAGIQLPALSFSRDALPNQAVFAAGYPGAERPPTGFSQYSGQGRAPAVPLAFTAGRVNRVINRDPLLLAHNAYCKSGNSGGPIVNARGEVVAMQTWSAAPEADGTVTSFALGSRDLLGFLEANGQRPAAVGQGAPRPPQLGGRDAKAFVLGRAGAGDADFLALAGLLSFLGDCGFSRDESGAVNYLAQAVNAAPNSGNAYLYRAGLAAVVVRSPQLRSSHQPEQLLRLANNSPHADSRLLAFEAGLRAQGRASGFRYDPEGALLLAERAMAGGFALPLAQTGYHYYFGDTRAGRDHHKAMVHAREAARGGVPEGISLLAHLYYDSDVVARTPENLGVARKLALEAARMNDPWAMGLLANIFYESDNPQEKAQAPQLARYAAYYGNRFALYCLGRIAWDDYLANPADVAQAAKAWALIDVAERRGVRIALRGRNGQNLTLRSSRDVLGVFPPDMQHWLVAEGRREQAVMVG